MRTQAVMNQISKEFYERKNTDEAIDKSVFMSAVKNVFEDICEQELERNQTIFETRLKIKGLLKSFKKPIRWLEKAFVKSWLFSEKDLKTFNHINAPRLKRFIDTLSNNVYTIFMHHQLINNDLKDKLRAMAAKVSHGTSSSFVIF